VELGHRGTKARQEKTTPAVRAESARTGEPGPLGAGLARGADPAWSPRRPGALGEGQAAEGREGVTRGDPPESYSDEVPPVPVRERGGREVLRGVRRAAGPGVYPMRSVTVANGEVLPRVRAPDGAICSAASGSAIRLP
jgi:hypothetical protein